MYVFFVYLLRILLLRECQTSDVAVTHGDKFIFINFDQSISRRRELCHGIE